MVEVTAPTESVLVASVVELAVVTLVAMQAGVGGVVVEVEGGGRAEVVEAEVGGSDDGSRGGSGGGSRGGEVVVVILKLSCF